MVNPKNDWVNGNDRRRAEEDLGARGAGQDHELESGPRRFSRSSAQLYGAGVDSGTYDYFTAAIVGKEHSSRGDFTASEDDNVLVQGIAGDINALGFFGLAYYLENKNKLKAVAIKPKEDRRRPAVGRDRKGRHYQPLSRPIFIYVSKKSVDTKPEVGEVRGILSQQEERAKLVKEVGYVPLPDKRL